MDDDQLKPRTEIIDRIAIIRGERVLLDIHLAEIYEVETRVLKQAVRRNIDLFPGDFMFTLTKDEIATMVSQNVIPSWQSLGGAIPFAFTEGGVAMLSGVLKSNRAKQMNICIMRAFVALRKIMADNSGLRIEIERIKLTLGNHEKNIELVFQYLDELVDKNMSSEPERASIGYDIGRSKPS